MNCKIFWKNLVYVWGFVELDVTDMEGNPGNDEERDGTVTAPEFSESYMSRFR